MIDKGGYSANFSTQNLGVFWHLWVLVTLKTTLMTIYSVLTYPYIKNIQYSTPLVYSFLAPGTIIISTKWSESLQLEEIQYQEGDASAEAIRLGLCFFSSMVFDDLDSKQKQLTLKKFAKLNINLAQPYNGLNTLSNLGQIAK